MSTRHSKDVRKSLLEEEFVMQVLEEPEFLSKDYPNEYGKTFLALLICIFGITSSCLSLAIVHDRQPVLPPLEDLVFRFVPQMDNGLEISEYIILLVTYPTLFMVLFHQHRWIILRRAFLLMGFLYFGRAITMLVTALPQADLKFPCSAKANITSVALYFHRTFFSLSGFGMSINGKMIYCGDFIYSGHTCSVVLCSLFFAEYSPQNNRFFKICKWILYGLSALAICFISVSRTHYTIDIVIAYVVATTVFRLYHTVAANEDFKTLAETNPFYRMWCFRVIHFFEVNTRSGKLPIRYCWPCTSRPIVFRSSSFASSAALPA